jgi:hypothetical protein
MGVDPLLASLVLSALAVVGSVLACVLVAFRTPSQEVKRAHKIVESAVRGWTEERELFGVTRNNWTREFEALSERCDEILETASKRRNRATAAAAKVDAANQTPQPGQGEGWWEGLPRAQVIQLMRERRTG